MGRMAANRLLSTETNYIANQATAEAYEDAGDKGVLHLRYRMENINEMSGFDGQKFAFG